MPAALKSRRKATRQNKYTKFAKTMHWLVAVGVLGLLAVGLWMTQMKMSPQKIQLYMTHKSVGLTILALMLVRIGYRWRHAPPALPETIPAWQARASRWSHALLYVLLLAMPLSGWLMNSASGFPMKYFGLFRVPNLIERSQSSVEFFKSAHELIAWALICLIALHVSAALKHHFIDRDDVLRRML
jgi:cytochrome b561